MSEHDISPDPSVSAEEERERVLQAVIAHAVAQEVRFSSVTPKERVAWWKWGLSGALFGVAVMLLVLPPWWTLTEPPPTLAPGDLERGVRATLFLTAQQVEAFRMERSRLPANAAELGPPVEGVRYVRTDNRLFQLVAFRPNGLALVYDSSRPEPGFEAIAGPWLRPDP